MSDHLDRDPDELRAIIVDLGVRSQIAVPFNVRGERRGVMMVCSAVPECFSLVASGLTNMEIAERLVLTPGTVANHIEGSLRRLGFRSRTQVAALLGDPNLARPDPGE